MSTTSQQHCSHHACPECHNPRRDLATGIAVLLISAAIINWASGIIHTPAPIIPNLTYLESLAALLLIAPLKARNVRIIR